MSESNRPPIGSIGWIDLTVPDAEGIRDFYVAVTGWRPEPVSMGDYSDFSMTLPSSGTPVAGICHARGSNLGLPAQWLIYITVADVDVAAAACEARGGRIVRPAGKMGAMGRFCVIQDPAGAVAILYQAA